MEDNNKYWLNEFGKRRWKHKTELYEMQRSYHWVDRVIIMNNQFGSRRHDSEIKFSTMGEDSIIVTHFIDDKPYLLSLNYDDFEIIDKAYQRRKKLERVLK